MFQKLIKSFVILFALEMVLAEYAVQYSAETFPIEMAKKDHFVMFYTTWCSISQDLAPTWEQLARRINRIEGGRVRIAKVDCNADAQICQQNHISGYPTLKFFRAGRRGGIKFVGRRNLQSLMSYINRQTASSPVARTTVTDSQINSYNVFPARRYYVG